MDLRRTTRSRHQTQPGAKFSSSGALFAKQRKLVAGRSQGPSPHPASSRDGDGAQKATVLACCGLREARTRVRARAAYKVCVCVQYRTRENVLSESASLAFLCFPCPEMNTRPRPADSEVQLKAPGRGPCADALTHVTFWLVTQCVAKKFTPPAACGLLLAAADGDQEVGTRAA